MFLCRRLPALYLSSVLVSRSSVTVSWPIKKGHDPLAWNGLMQQFLTGLKEDMKFYQSTKQYRVSYNGRVQTTKTNIAKIMGVDPKCFTDADFKLSLLYLLPSDLEKKEYRPSIPGKLPVKSILDILSQYHGTDSRKEAVGIKEQEQNDIKLVHGVVLDAAQEVEKTPGLELFIDPEEIITLDETNSDLPISSEFLEASDVITKDHVDSVHHVDSVDNVIGEHFHLESYVEYCPALETFPFRPNIKTEDELVRHTLDLQFKKLNHLIQHRPDLIKMYYPTLKHLLPSSKATLEHLLPSSKATLQSAEPHEPSVFRARINRAFLSHSVVTTVIPGSGIITINDQSFLDFFPEIISRMIVISPLRLSKTLGVFDINVQIEQDEFERAHSLAHCIAMSVADCIKMYNKRLGGVLLPVYKKPYRVEYKKAAKKNSRARYTWRKR